MIDRDTISPQLTALALLSRTANTLSPVFTKVGSRLYVTVNTTASSGSPTLKLRIQSSNDGTNWTYVFIEAGSWGTLIQPVYYSFEDHGGAVASVGATGVTVAGVPMGPLLQFYVTGSVGDPVTYSIKYAWV